MEAIAVLAALAFLVWLAILVHPDRPWVPLSGERGSQAAQAPERPPVVSIVIPARDEEKTIGAALRSHNESTWPLREVIVVDDGSTDLTAPIAREFAERAACAFTILPAGDAPAGWVGKVNAMRRGVEAARGAYILFADADVVFEPDALESLVRESEARRLGLNSRMVLLAAHSFWERVLVPAFVYFFALLYPFRAVGRQRSRIAAAAGGCMLVRREALEAAGGLEAIRGEIIDDVALARRIKAAGFPVALAHTRAARSLRRYTLGTFWRTVTRTAFTELRYSWVRLALTTAALLLVHAAPLLALGAGAAAGDRTVAALGAAATFISISTYVPTVAFMGVPWPFALSLPLVGLLYLAMTWHSALGYAAVRRSAWKGREYRR